MKLINHIEYYQNSCCLSFMECLQKKGKMARQRKGKANLLSSIVVFKE